MTFRTYIISYYLIIIINSALYSIINCDPPSRIVVGAQNQLININSDCEQYEVLTNYKHVSIKISNIKNLDRVLITDKVITNCNTKECAKDSHICQVKTVNQESEILFDSKLCVGAIYINVRRSFNPNPEADGKTEYSFKISTDYIRGESCSYSHENSFVYCSESSLEDCRTCKRKGCTAIQCGNEQKHLFQKSYELCVPYNLEDNKKLQSCLNFQNVTTYRSTGECEYDDLDGYSSLTIFILGIAVIFVLVFGLAVIYYNVYLMKYQTPPFYVPSYMPEFLFPRGSGKGTRTTMDNRLDDVFATDNRQNF